MGDRAGSGYGVGSAGQVVPGFLGFGAILAGFVGIERDLLGFVGISAGFGGIRWDSAGFVPGGACFREAARVHRGKLVLRGTERNVHQFCEIGSVMLRKGEGPFHPSGPEIPGPSGAHLRLKPTMKLWSPGIHCFS